MVFKFLSNQVYTLIKVLFLRMANDHTIRLLMSTVYSLISFSCSWTNQNPFFTFFFTSFHIGIRCCSLWFLIVGREALDVTGRWLVLHFLPSKGNICVGVMKQLRNPPSYYIQKYYRAFGDHQVEIRGWLLWY